MQILINALIAGSLAALIAGSLGLVYGVLGIFNMALGQLALCGGYITWWLHQVHGLTLLPSIIGGLLGGALLTWLTFEIFVEPFYKRHRFLPLVTTIAWSMILDGLLLIVVQTQPRQILPGLATMHEFGSIRISTEQMVLIAMTAVILITFGYLFHATRYGRQLRAVVQHQHAALSVGLPAPLLFRTVFILSGIFAAAGGIFIGIDQNLTPTLAFSLTIKAYAAIIMGGRGNVWGAVLAAYLIALLEQFAIGIHWFGSFYIPAGYQQTVALLVIVIFLLFRPQGMFGEKHRFG